MRILRYKISKTIIIENVKYNQVKYFSYGR